MISFLPATGCFPDCGCKGTPFFAFRQTLRHFFFKKTRIFANPDTRREGLLIIYGDKTVPPRRGTSHEAAEGVSRPRAAIIAVLCAMRRGVTTLFAPCGGHNGRPVRHAGWQRGRETPPALRATSPARRRSSYHAPKVSEPGTPSFRAWNTQFQGLEHTVSKPGTHSFKARNTQFQTLETHSFKA